MIIRSFLSISISLLCILNVGRSNADEIKSPQLIEVRKIWDAGKHNAFTDLIRFQDQWYCTFRESTAHVGGDGGIRVISSKDGKDWKSIAYITEKEIDLRDPKFSITPDGRLMIVAGGSVYKGGKVLLGRQPRVMFSADAIAWTAPQRVLGEGDWLWRVTWHKGVAYGISYIPQARVLPNAKAAANREDTIKPGPADWKLKLVRSTDGIEYEILKYLDVPGFANESTVRFMADDTMVALVRREAGNRHGWIGTSRPPYTEWKWNETDYRLGGPNFLVMEDGTMWTGSRDHRQKESKTAIGRMTDQRYTPELVLPSGGDNSYPGFVMYQNELWMSYYSSHEGKTSIYLARLQLPKGPNLAADDFQKNRPRKILMVGDSTMSSYLKPSADRPTLTGWGQVFAGQFQGGKVDVANQAVSGMSTKTCFETGQWDKTLKLDGDYIFIQFGHNDQPGKAKSSPAETTFRDHLRRMINEARQRAMKPVLVTPVARRTFKNGHATSTLGPYVEAVLAVGKEMNVPVLDLHQASFQLFEKLGDEKSSDFSPSATDRTHFSHDGANTIVGLVAELVRQNNELKDLAELLKKKP
jgi:lysophospholipase L1-like esterase